ncbi:MAG: hypothetical protein ACOVOG_12360, partial [Rubrivivax sp.]
MHTMLISVARPLWLVVPFFVAGLAWAQSGAASPQPVAKPPVSSVLKEVRSVEGITEYTLPNGLQVLLAPDDSKP